MASAVGLASRGERPRPLTSEVVAVLVAIAAVGTACWRGVMWDEDAYFLIATGRALLEQGFVQHDPLTLHEGLPFACQQWGSTVVMALLDAAGGKPAVVLAWSALWLAAFALAWRAALAESGGRRAIAAVVSAVFFAVMVPYLRTNPRVFDVMALLAAWALCSRFASDGKLARFGAITVALSVAFASLHGALWPVLVLPGACWACLPGLTARRRAALVAVPAASALAALAASPYGLEVVPYALAALLSPTYADFHIAELEPTPVLTPFTVAIVALPAVAAALAARGHGGCGLAPRAALFLAMLALGAASARQVYTFDTAALVLFAFLLKDARLPDVVRGCLPRRRFACALAAAFAATAAVLGVLGVAWDEVPERARAVDAVLEAGVEEGASVISDGNDGAYLEYRGLAPYLDARFELFCPELNGGQDVGGAYLDYKQGKTSIADVAASVGADAVVLPEPMVLHGTVEELAAAGYEIVLDETAEGGYLAMVGGAHDEDTILDRDKEDGQ